MKKEVGFLFVILLTGTVVDAKVQYLTVGFLGDWGGNGILQDPSHVFTNGTHLFISDGSSGKVFIADRKSLDGVFELAPYFSNGSAVGVILETIVYGNGTFVSLLATGVLVTYNFSGLVVSEYNIPLANLGYGVDKIHLGMDVASDVGLIYYITTIDGVNQYVVQILDLAVHGVPEFVYVAGGSSSPFFSYNNTVPVLFEVSEDGLSLIEVQFRRWGNGSYGYLQIRHLMEDTGLLSYVHNGQGIGILEDGFVVSSAEEVRVYFMNGTFVGLVDSVAGHEISGMSSIIGSGSTIFGIVDGYDVVVGLEFLELEAIPISDGSGISSPSNGNRFPNILFAIFLFILIGIVAILFYLKRS